jgi:hypothetical protein
MQNRHEQHQDIRSVADARRTRLRQTSRVRAELALFDRLGPQPLTPARLRPQQARPGRGVAPVRPFSRSLKIVHLADARVRLRGEPDDRPRIAR